MLKFNSIVPRVWLKLNKVNYGKNIKLIGWPFIFRFKAAKIRIGDNVAINSNFFSNLLGLYQRTIIIAKSNAIVIVGDNTGISGATIYAWDKIEIGTDCKIGANVKIIDNDFHPIDANSRISDDNSKVIKKEVVVGNNVFIGMNSIILKGTHIGNNCVIGAGSVVSGTFENNCIIAGNPARVIRKLAL